METISEINPEADIPVIYMSKDEIKTHFLQLTHYASYKIVHRDYLIQSAKMFVLDLCFRPSICCIYNGSAHYNRL